MRYRLVVPFLLAACSAPRPLNSIGHPDGAPFRDCPTCPALVVLPAGKFTMGSPESEIGHEALEGPQRLVTVARFAAGRYPVTRGEWARFVTATQRPTASGCAWIGTSTRWRLDSTGSWIHQQFAQDSTHPVVCVSWQDAQDYVHWLSKQTGHTYRLLSEAEWEYAARATSPGPYWWGETATHEHANYGAEECCSIGRDGRDQWEYTSPVAAFPPNSFGLFDMLGNTLEWVQDCLTLYPAESTDGKAIETMGRLPATTALPAEYHGQPTCDYRIVRGGDWGNPPRMIRAAFRNFGPGPGATLATYRSGGLGFRVARSLP